MKILVSACLLGNPCRYDEKVVPCKEVINLKKDFELIPICPEQAGGLKTPRIPAERNGDKIITKNGEDVTKEYVLGAKRALDVAIKNKCKIAILKEKSPSCGKGKIYDGSFSKTLVEGDGVTVELLMKSGIIVIGESEISNLYDENLLEKI